MEHHLLSGFLQMSEYKLPCLKRELRFIMEDPSELLLRKVSITLFSLP